PAAPAETPRAAAEKGEADRNRGLIAGNERWGNLLRHFWGSLKRRLQPLLRASHIIPWKDCESDAERLDVHNGLLLSALWDAAFDRGVVSFDDGGQPIFSPVLGENARSELRWKQPIALTDKHRTRLAWHRSHLFKSE
ncbi:MAG: HNH endonuclease, partial [Pseudomonadota bacterium]